MLDQQLVQVELAIHFAFGWRGKACRDSALKEGEAIALMLHPLQHSLHLADGHPDRLSGLSEFAAPLRPSRSCTLSSSRHNFTSSVISVQESKKWSK
ncbi:MAG: hypothetical protein LLG04_07955 [Parachlamydia sp.]|nr:hypothetical protein [Parachlamydia sp.]